MRKLYTFLYLMFMSSIVYASPIGDIKTWIIDKAIYAVITIVFGITIVGVWTDWVCKFLVSIGSTMVVVGMAFKDKKITKEEVAEIKAKIIEVKNIVKKVPRK